MIPEWNISQISCSTISSLDFIVHFSAASFCLFCCCTISVCPFGITTSFSYFHIHESGQAPYILYFLFTIFIAKLFVHALRTSADTHTAIVEDLHVLVHLPFTLRNYYVFIQGYLNWLSDSSNNNAHNHNHHELTLKIWDGLTFWSVCQVRIIYIQMNMYDRKWPLTVSINRQA